MLTDCLNEERLEQACAHPLHRSERERGGGRERERGRERGRERESDKEGERERCRIFISLLLTMAALEIKCFSIVQNCYF